MEASYCPIHDFRGNIVALIDESGQPAEIYRYTAFGECKVHSHTLSPYNPWRFANKRHDPETGFAYFLRRYYSPSNGRWITPDPIGFTDGPNMYAYVHNNPFTGFDLYGLFTSEDEYDALAGAGLYGMLEVSARTVVDLTSFTAHVFKMNSVYEMCQRCHDALDIIRNKYADSVASMPDSKLAAQEIHKAIDAGITSREMLDVSRLGINVTKMALHKSRSTLNMVSKERHILEKSVKGTVGNRAKDLKSSERSFVGDKLPDGHMWTKASPFREKSADDLHKMFLDKGFKPHGPDPKNGFGNYINKKMDGNIISIQKKSGRYDEPNHVDVSRPKNYIGELGKKRFSYADG